MQDKKTYTIDENALREKFSNYHVSFDPSSLDFLDNEIAHVKTHQPIELPEAKNIVKLIAIPVSLVVLGCIVYFGYGYVKSISPSAASTPKDTIIITKKINAPIKEEHKVPDVQVSTPTVSVETETKKQVTSLTPVVPQKIKNTVKATVPEPDGSGRIGQNFPRPQCSLWPGPHLSRPLDHPPGALHRAQRITR